MDLSERKRKILQAIIDEYIGTAEPVGSRVISKKNELGLSSATIRNEMADLEELGFLVQPHTSAGRIPSDMGYRFYVNSLMQRYQVSVEAMEKMKNEFQKRVDELDGIIKKASFITSALTEYTTVVTAPMLSQSEIKKIDLVSLGADNVMLILVTKAGMVKNQLMHMSLDDETALRFSQILNEKFSGLTVDAITFEKINELQSDLENHMNVHPKVLIEILNYIYKMVESLDETEVYVNNAKSILKYPEYNDVKKAEEIFGFLEDQANLKSIVDKSNDSDGKLNITIGSENKFEQLKDCSLVTVNYSLGNKAVGKIGVIGPKRMNYAKVIASLDCIASHIDKILYELYIESE